MSKIDQKIVINPNKLKVRDETFVSNKLKYKMTIVESKKAYNRKKLSKVKETE